jgi:hypothetical protein
LRHRVWGLGFRAWLHPTDMCAHAPAPPALSSRRRRTSPYPPLEPANRRPKDADVERDVKIERSASASFAPALDAPAPSLGAAPTPSPACRLYTGITAVCAPPVPHRCSSIAPSGDKSRACIAAACAATWRGWWYPGTPSSRALVSTRAPPQREGGADGTGDHAEPLLLILIGCDVLSWRPMRTGRSPLAPPPPSSRRTVRPTLTMCASLPPPPAPAPIKV